MRVIRRPHIHATPTMQETPGRYAPPPSHNIQYKSRHAFHHIYIPHIQAQESEPPISAAHFLGTSKLVFSPSAVSGSNLVGVTRLPAPRIARGVRGLISNLCGLGRISPSLVT
jgi:hypothetical protein